MSERFRTLLRSGNGAHRSTSSIAAFSAAVALSTSMYGSLARAQVAPNMPSDFPEVVRIQGTTNQATGSLIGEAVNGSSVTLTLLTAEHLVRKYGALSTVGFGDIGSPQLNLTNFAQVTTTTGGLDGAEDIAVIGVTVNLASLSSSQQAYLRGLSPLSVGLAPPPTALPYLVEDFGFGLSGSGALANTSYGSQGTFLARVDSQSAFSGTYEGKSYTEPVQTWTYHMPNVVTNEGTGYSGYSGSPLFLYSGTPPTAASPIIGFQVQGNQPIDGAVSMGLDFTASEVSWIDATSAHDLTPVPLPGTAWLLLSGFCSLMVVRKRQR